MTGGCDRRLGPLPALLRRGGNRKHQQGGGTRWGEPADPQPADGRTRKPPRRASVRLAQMRLSAPQEPYVLFEARLVRQDFHQSLGQGKGHWHQRRTDTGGHRRVVACGRTDPEPRRLVLSEGGERGKQSGLLRPKARDRVAAPDDVTEIEVGAPANSRAGRQIIPRCEQAENQARRLASDEFGIRRIADTNDEVEVVVYEAERFQRRCDVEPQGRMLGHVPPKPGQQPVPRHALGRRYPDQRPTLTGLRSKVPLELFERTKKRRGVMV